MSSAYIFGAGGHSRVVCDLLSILGFAVAAVVDENPSSGAISKEEFFSSAGKDPKIIVAVGDNFLRAQIAKEIAKELPGTEFISAIHPSAVVASDVSIGLGTVVMAGAVISTGCQIGEHVIVNTTSSVDHDCNIGDFTSIAPGASVGGTVNIGDFSAVSLGASISHGVKIGRHAVVGAGSLVLKNMDDFSLSYGVPAKFIRSRSEGEKYL